jgi:hypothetical protein
MEMINIPRVEYERMQNALRILKEIEKIDVDLVRQFKGSLEDVRAGKIRAIC